jgi:hypothetical protein
MLVKLSNVFMLNGCRMDVESPVRICGRACAVLATNSRDNARLRIWCLQPQLFYQFRHTNFAHCPQLFCNAIGINANFIV